MKKILFTIIGFVLLTSCSFKSNEEKARDLIEPQIKAYLIKPESYEFAQLQLDSCFSNSNTRPEVFVFMMEIDKLYKEYKMHMFDAERAESCMTIYTSTYGYQSSNKEQQQKNKADMEKAQRKAAVVKGQILQTYKNNKELFLSVNSPNREFIGWSAIFNYRAETAGGIKTMGTSLFFLNKDMTEITYSFSEEEMSAVNLDNLQDINYEFEEELQELFLEQ